MTTTLQYDFNAPVSVKPGIVRNESCLLFPFTTPPPSPPNKEGGFP